MGQEHEFLVGLVTKLLTREVDSSGGTFTHCLLSAWNTDVMLEQGQPYCKHEETSNARDG